MSIVPDYQILELVDNGLVEGGVTDEQIQPASLDLRLGEEYYDVRNGKHQTGNTLRFMPAKRGYFYLCHTEEYINVPDGYAASLWGRSSVGRKGVQIHNAGWLDPGFSGQLTLEISNLVGHHITLERGTRVCQIVLHKMADTPQVPYGEERGSKYNGQTGAQTSKLHEED